MVKPINWISPADKYFVSDSGHVYRICNNSLIQLKEFNRSKGYRGVYLSGKAYLVHRLVAIAFLGLDEGSKMQVNHIDGNKEKNVLSNLEVVTPSENIRHSYRTRLNTSVLSKDTAVFIKEVPQPGTRNFSYKVWCDKLGISEKNVYRIKKLDRNYSEYSDNRLTKILLDDSLENLVYKVQVEEFYRKHPEFTK